MKFYVKPKNEYPDKTFKPAVEPGDGLVEVEVGITIQEDFLNEWWEYKLLGQGKLQKPDVDNDISHLEDIINQQQATIDNLTTKLNELTRDKVTDDNRANLQTRLINGLTRDNNLLKNSFGEILGNLSVSNAVIRQLQESTGKIITKITMPEMDVTLSDKVVNTAVPDPSFDVLELATSWGTLIPNLDFFLASGAITQEQYNKLLESEPSNLLSD